MGKTANAAKLKLSEEVIFTQLDRDDGILLNLETKNYYSLNESACLILNALRRGDSEAGIIKKFTNSFGISPARARKDISKIITYLTEEKII